MIGPGEHLVVPEERSGMELDEFVCLAVPRANKGFVRREIRAGRVLVDGVPAQPSQRLRRDQVVSLSLEEDELPEAPAAPSVQVPILYEDEAVLVVDKPAGLSVEPERWARDAACVSGALLELAVERSRADGDEPALGFRPRLVHRIDKDTTGVLLVAKTLEAERALRAAFQNGEVAKSYLTLVEGEYPLEEGEEDLIDLPIAPDARRSGRMCVREGGKPSRTRVVVRQRFRGFTLLECEPLTGRTHQIRVHLSERGFPLVVDRLYGRRDGLRLSEIKRGYRPKRGAVEQPLIRRLTLHAAELRFPAQTADDEGRQLTVSAPLPRDFERALKQLAKVRPARP